LTFPLGFLGATSKLKILGILDEEACLDPLGVCLPDLIEEAALPVEDAALIAAIAGALSSTSQLHYLESASIPRIRSYDLIYRPISYPEELP
jgi:hypothetical protein